MPELHQPPPIVSDVKHFAVAVVASIALRPLSSRSRTFRFCMWFTEHSTEQWAHGINFDALLICIFAGYVVANCNQSRNRRQFLRFLSSIGACLFIPFFTLTGATLNLKAILGLQAAARLRVHRVHRSCRHDHLRIPRRLRRRRAVHRHMHEQEAPADFEAIPIASSIARRHQQGRIRSGPRGTRSARMRRLLCSGSNVIGLCMQVN